MASEPIRIFIRGCVECEGEGTISGRDCWSCKGRSITLCDEDDAEMTVEIFTEETGDDGEER